MACEPGSWRRLASRLRRRSLRAQSVSDVEGARMKERQGRHLNRMDREQLRRYGGNDDYGYRYRGDGYDYGPYDGPGVSVYVGPRPYYRPYGY